MVKVSKHVIEMTTRDTPKKKSSRRATSQKAKETTKPVHPLAHILNPIGYEDIFGIK